LNRMYLLYINPALRARIATRYRLDSLGINSRGSEIFCTVQTGPRAHPASYTMGTRSFPEVKRPGRVVDHPPLAPAKIKERKE
jgi:hypothetical protein